MYSQPDDETKKVIIKKQHRLPAQAQDTQQLPWVKATFMSGFPTIGWQAVTIS